MSLACRALNTTSFKPSWKVDKRNAIGYLMGMKSLVKRATFLNLAVYVHPYEAKLCSQWLNLAENQCANSDLEL